MLTMIEETPIYMAGSTVIWGIGSVLGPVVSFIFLVRSNVQMQSMCACVHLGAIIYRLVARLQIALRLGDG